MVFNLKTKGRFLASEVVCTRVFVSEMLSLGFFPCRLLCREVWKDQTLARIPVEVGPSGHVNFCVSDSLTSGASLTLRNGCFQGQPVPRDAK